jgi:hypothetical protein
MPRSRIALVAPILLALLCLQLLSGCLLVPVDDGRRRGGDWDDRGHDRGYDRGYDHDRRDDHRR